MVDKESATSDHRREFIHLAVQRGRLNGGRRFVDEIEQKFYRRIELRGQSRPRKVKYHLFISLDNRP